MNSQRLLAISNSLAEELQAVNLLDLMHTISNQLQDAMNSPSEDTQRAVQTTREDLETKLREAKSNSMSPGMRVDLGALKINNRTLVSELIGLGLLRRLNTAFDSGYVSVGSLDQINQLAEDIQGLDTALKQLNRGAEGLALRTEQLEPGESVVGFTIPREAVTEELDLLLKEVKFFGSLVSMVAEVVEGSRGDPVKVRSLQSSDFAIDFATNIALTASLVSCHTLRVGYRRLSLVRASGLVNCQSIRDLALFRRFCQAPTSAWIWSRLSILRSRHCLMRTLSSISAMLSQLPCFGVYTNSKRSHNALATSGSNVS